MEKEPKSLSTQYDPKQIEDKTYEFWMDGGYFHAVPQPDKKPYTIIMPPPNITGKLHMGHAMDCTLQDILIRFRRMQGYEALWLPGTDHASIATEVRILGEMREEGLSKEDIGREGFLERAWAWKEKYGDTIVEQQKKLGSSCDWDRQQFTMDEGCSKAVREAFVRLYDKGLIYRGERMINWCPDCMTTISDAEVEHEEQSGHFWHINYPLVGEEGCLVIATTRPETMLGDTALAVHPEDERYKHLIGRKVLLPLMNREIPIVGDDYVESDFGTGVVKITPAHDPNDLEVGERHGLEIINIMNEDASINNNGGLYEGLSREEARKAVVRDLEAQGFLLKVEDHEHNVGTCYRCHSVVEPRISLQWFVEMGPLAKPAIKAVEEKETVIIPERFERVYFNWMNKIRDWSISRQLWWGHQIPAWYCGDCEEITVSRTDPTTCSACGSSKIKRDPDVLDTWFSSALWPFSTLGWPEKTPELDYFYPTNTLVTAYDIIFFWVARMIFSGIEQMGEVPFDTVFIHGLVRAEDGQKMSKSLDNGIDPLDVVEEFGADPLRFMLATGVSPGNDMRYSPERMVSSRNFANKIWNAVRYVLMNLTEEIPPSTLPADLVLEDRWILDLYSETVKEVTHHLDTFELGLAANKLYEFTWDILCDWYIELTKSRIQQGGDTAKNAQMMLVYLLDGVLKMLHPFMPFVTEELWQALPHTGATIMTAPWPEVDASLSFPKEKEEFQMVLDAIRAIRVRRGEMNVPPSKKASVYIETDHLGVFSQGVPFIQRLASAGEVHVGDQIQLEGAVQVVTSGARILMPLDELVDMEKEKERLQKELDHVVGEIDVFTKKLSNKAFVDRAPEAVVQKEKERLKKAEETKEKILESMDSIS